MKKLLALLLSLAMIFGLTACGDKTGGDETADGGDKKDPTKVVLLVPRIGDQSYFDVTNRGLDLLNDMYGDEIETHLVEMGTDSANWATANMQAANDGYDIIISGNFMYEGDMIKVAKQFPDIKYLNFDYGDAEANALPNIYAVSYAESEIGYLCGVVAGVKTKTNVIGAIGGGEFPGIKAFIAGYMQGALDANPDVKVATAFVGNFDDTVTAKNLAETMIKQNADVIWHAAGGAGNGMFEAVAEAENVWAIGVDTDQYEIFKEGKPEIAKHILTSGLKNCDIAVRDSIKAIIEGTAPFGTARKLNYASGGVGLAENENFKANMTEEELARVHELTEKLKNGETTVVDELTNPGVFEEYKEKTKLN